MTDTLALEIAIKKSNMTKREVAKYLNISEMALYNKIHGISEFKSSEVSKLKIALGLSAQDMTNIFFTT